MTQELMFTAEDVAEIVTILDKSPYDRLDIRTGRLTLRVIRNGAGFTQELEFADESAPGTRAIAAETAAAVEEDGVLAIRSPLPGTFYRAPQPGAAAFVEVGDKVAPDTVIAIIETMKLMTSVPAGCHGVITEIVAENAKLVDADALLMRVKAA